MSFSIFLGLTTNGRATGQLATGKKTGDLSNEPMDDFPSKIAQQKTKPPPDRHKWPEMEPLFVCLSFLLSNPDQYVDIINWAD